MQGRKISVRPLLVLALVLAGPGLTGCGGSDSSQSKAEFAVSITNLTNAQPFTPPAAVLHEGGYRAWQEGQSASGGLERLAEGGKTDKFLSAAEANDAVLATRTADKGVDPGKDRTLNLKAPTGADFHLTLASMLAATNDGFTGVNALDIADLGVGDSESMLVEAWDAGTEANTETSATVPGLGGEGYNAARDSLVDRVTVHPGVVTQDDGLATSDLTAAQRFDRPVARVTVTRVQ
ncbi:MAG TPA: spondin domain-containing protein [Gammaproteobacteria bacterium]|nr:spondin domain-containing protein [Gammaproteobacteria bacterium]